MNVNEQQRIFESWLKEHRGLCFKVVRAFAFNPHDQEDLFQEIATQVFHSIRKFRGDSKVSTWIYRVALYAAMGWSKKERKYRDQHETLSEHETVLRQNVKTLHPRLEWLYDQISKLNEVDRSLTLMMIDGYSYREIADTLGLTESNVGVRLNRIKKGLTEQSNLEENYGI